MQQLCYGNLEKPSTSRICLETISKKGAIGTSPRSVVSSLQSKDADSCSEWMTPPWNSPSSFIIVWWYLYWQMSQNDILRWFMFRLNEMFGLNSEVFEVKPPQISMPCMYLQLRLIACRKRHLQIRHVYKVIRTCPLPWLLSDMQINFLMYKVSYDHRIKEQFRLEEIWSGL